MPAGQVIVADDAPELIEGSWHGKRTVIVEFDSVQATRELVQAARISRARRSPPRRRGQQRSDRRGLRVATG